MVGGNPVGVEPTGELKEEEISAYVFPSTIATSSSVDSDSSVDTDFCNSLLTPIVPDASCMSQGLMDCDVEGYLQAACTEDFESVNLESLLAICTDY